MNKQLSRAQLSSATDKPFSTQFEDCYFASADGVAESQFNFLDGNNLPQRFREATPTLFTVGETGFGTGLNFLLTAQLWRDVAPKERALHYVSTEKHPIEVNALAEIYRQQGWNDSLCKLVIDNYPALNVGVHRLQLSSTITLTLLFGDAAEQLSEFEFTADAWFLDGFAPARNPDMWSLPLCKSLAKRSRSGTTFATFTAASAVRKNLLEAGFVVNKSSGFGRKRERLVGYKP